MSDKIYIGFGKEKVFDSGGSSIRFSIPPDDLEKLRNFAIGNDGWCTIDISKRKEASSKGYTHYGVLNTYKRTKNAEETFPRKDDEVPF